MADNNSPAYVLTNENLVVESGGGKYPQTRHQKQFPIYRDSQGVEYLSLPGKGMVKISNLRHFYNAKKVQRETT